MSMPTEFEQASTQGRPSQTEMTYAQAIREAMCEEMRRDKDVFLMGEDIGVYRGAFGVTQEMYKEFPDRVMDTPISEAGFVGCAIGAAVEGMRPIVEIMFSDFMSCCWDMLLNQAPKMRYMFGGKVSVPMVLRTASGGGTGAAAQHSQSLEAMLCHIPGLKVVVPSTPYDAKGLLKSAIRDNNPVIFLEQKLLYRTKGMVPSHDYTIPLGKADIKRLGTDCTIVTYGRMVQTCLAAAETLAKEGILTEVIDLRTLLPMDKNTIVDSVRKTKHLVIVHEAVKTGGLGGEIAASIAESDAFYYLDAPIRRLASEDVPVPFSPVLEKGILPNEEKICEAVRETVS
ncbi:MAG: alpha-ketoacid dehydrogenase subunit beta [Lachnospiraceae bacterium]|nr:alpha-ketoacid dehydrogenase subunit beta [Lachnospiraceae bacterium]